VPEAHFIGMIDVYAKNEADDLISEQKKELKNLADRLRNDLLEAGKEQR
jgi:hypothetical protein